MLQMYEANPGTLALTPYLRNAMRRVQWRSRTSRIGRAQREVERDGDDRNGEPVKRRARRGSQRHDRFHVPG